LKIEVRKALLLFLILFFTWQILYVASWSLGGLDWLLAYSILLAVAVCFFVIDKQKLTDLGFRNPLLLKRYVVIGFMSAVAIVIYWAVLGPLILPTEPRKIFQNGAFTIVYNAVFALVIGLVEEASFRGYILRNFHKTYSETKAIIYSSFLFGLYHISFPWIYLSTTPPSQTFTYWSSYILFTFVVGLFLSYFYLSATQTTVGTIAHHSSHIFLSGFVPYALATSFTIGYLLNTVAYTAIFLFLILLKRKGWLTNPES